MTLDSHAKKLIINGGKNRKKKIYACTLGCPKKMKFCDSGQMMGEVIIK